MFFARRCYRCLLPPLMVAVLIVAAAFPVTVRADDEIPPPEPVPAATDVPEGTPIDEDSTDLPALEEATESAAIVPSDNGVEVGISDDDQRISAEGEMSPSVLTSTLPIWCPVGVEPVAGENGCTAEFGSISLLMEYMNSNSLGDQGQIWIPESDSSEAVETSSENAPAIGEGAAAVVDEGTGGVNVVILDNTGNSLPLDSEQGTNALLNGQPVWCPDGITPADGGETCTTSAASLGLLVSMMENGSLEDGAIYIQAPQSDAVVAEDSSLPPPEADAAVDGAGQENPQATDVPTNADDSSTNVVLHDPIWCPAFVPPDPGVGGCTGSFGSLDLLVAYLSGVLVEPGLGDGKIWMEAGLDTSGSVLINGSVLPNWRTKSLTFQGGWIGPPPGGLFAGDDTIVGNTTFGQSISIIGWQNGVSISNIVVSGATGTGLTVQTNSGVFLNVVTSNNNSGAGIDVTATDGLTDGFITASNITTTSNGTYGTWLDNCQKVEVFDVPTSSWSWSCGPGVEGVSVIGLNTFSDNGVAPAAASDRRNSGLVITTNGDVSVDNVTANQNDYYGVNITTQGGISVDTLGASDNRVGMSADNSVTSVVQAQTIGNIIANDNTGAGLALFSLGAINVDTVSADGNDGRALVLANDAGLAGVNIQNVNVINATTANGMSVTSSVGIIIACSAFSTSAPFFGFDASSFTTLQINGVTFSGTGGTYTTAGPGVVTIDPSCSPSTAPTGGGGGGGNGTGNTFINTLLGTGGSGPTSLNIVSLPGESGGNSVVLNCTDFGGTQLSLANGDRVTYLCPTTGEASLLRVENSEGSLPGPLPGNVAFISAMQTHLTEGSIEQRLTPGNLDISFVIPVDMIGFNVAILYWDGSAWSDLATAAFTDGRSVFGGGIKTEDGRFEAVTNFPGTFVLVRK